MPFKIYIEYWSSNQAVHHFLSKIASLYALLTDVEGSVNAEDGKLTYCILLYFLDKFCYLMPIRMCVISLRYHTWL